MGIFSSFGASGSASTVGILEVEWRGRDFIVTSLNDSFRVQFRILEDRFKNRPVRELLAGETGENLLRCLEECQSRQKILTRRICVPRSLTSEWFMLEIAPEETEDAEEKPRRFSVASMDVTELTECESVFPELQGVDRFLSHATDHASEPVLICDVRSDSVPIVHANAAFVRHFGYQRSELIGRDPVHLLFPDSEVAVLDTIESAWDKRGADWIHLAVIKKDGLVSDCEVVFDVHRTDNEDVQLLRLTFLPDRRASSRLTAEDHRRMQLATMLNASAILINDFNNLLAVVLGNERLLSQSTAQILDVVRYSKSCATQAADVLFDLVRGSEPSEILQRALANIPVQSGAVAGELPATTLEAVPSEESAPLKPGLRVLVADDEPSVREIIAQALTGAGCLTAQANSGEEALDLLNQLRNSPDEPQIDTVIVDYTMGGLSGLEVLQAMRTVGVNTPFVLVSGYFPQDAREAVAKEGGAVLLEKPFRINELSVAMAAAARAAAQSPLVPQPA